MTQFQQILIRIAHWWFIHIVNTTRNSALPLIMRAYASEPSAQFGNRHLQKH
jgi:hypothetical protein